MSQRKLINAAQFTPRPLKVSIENIATKSKISSDNVTKPNSSIQFIEFLETGIVLGIPTRSCATGHHVMVTLAFPESRDLPKFSATAKVGDLRNQDTQDLIRVDFMQYDQELWNRFVKKLTFRQNSAEALFSALKG